MYLSIAIMTSFVAQSVGLAIGAVLPLQVLSAQRIFIFKCVGIFIKFD